MVKIVYCKITITFHLGSTKRKYLFEISEFARQQVNLDCSCWELIFVLTDTINLKLAVSYFLIRFVSLIVALHDWIFNMLQLSMRHSPDR